MIRRPLPSDLDDTQEIPAPLLSELRGQVRKLMRDDSKRAYLRQLRAFRQRVRSSLFGWVAK